MFNRSEFDRLQAGVQYTGADMAEMTRRRLFS